MIKIKNVDIKLLRLMTVVYFLQGFYGIAGIALPLFLRKAGLSITGVTFFLSLASVPWFLKIIYGLVTDAFPIEGLRRKPYLILCSTLVSIGWLLMSSLPVHFLALILVMFVINIGFAATDVVMDGMVVERSSHKNAQTYQSFAWGIRSAGALVSGIIGGYLAFYVDYRSIFLIMAALPLLPLIVILRFEEKRVVKKPMNSLVTPLIKSIQHIRSGNMLWFCALLFVSTIPSSFIMPLFFYMKEHLRFDEKFLGLLGSTAWAGAILGCAIQFTLLRNIPLKTSLRIAFGFGVFGVLACLSIKGTYSAMVVYMLGGVLGYLSILPIMATAARLSHDTGVEGSLFAVLMSLHNLGQVSNGFLGGWLSEKIGIQSLIIISALAMFGGIIIINKLRTD